MAEKTLVQVQFDAYFAEKTTDDLPEGSTKHYSDDAAVLASAASDATAKANAAYAAAVAACPPETVGTLATIVENADVVATPDVSDEFGLRIDADSVVKRLSWGNLRAFLKTYFDAIYASLGLALMNFAPSGNVTITAGYSAYVSESYEIASGYYLEAGDGAVFEVG